MLLCCFFFAVVSADAQQTGIQAFVGRWEGTLHWYKAGEQQPQKVKMQLLIQPIDSIDGYTWQLVYGEQQQDNRPYLLKPVDTARGRWQVDERNGIVIDQYLVGNRLTSAFTVQSTTIVDSYSREGDSLVAEFYSFTAKPVSTTGAGTDESPLVSSYGAKGYQKAVLFRK